MLKLLREIVALISMEELELLQFIEDHIDIDSALNMIYMYNNDNESFEGKLS